MSVQIFILETCSPKHGFKYRWEVMKHGRVSGSWGVRYGDSSFGGRSQLSLPARQTTLVFSSLKQTLSFILQFGRALQGWLASLPRGISLGGFALTCLARQCWSLQVGSSVRAVGWSFCSLPCGPLHGVAWAPP